MKKTTLLKIANRIYISLFIIIMAPFLYYNVSNVLIEITKDKQFTTAHETLEKLNLSTKENREATYIEAGERKRERSANQGNAKYKERAINPIDEQCFDSFGNGKTCGVIEFGAMEIRSPSNFGIDHFEPGHILSAVIWALLNMLIGVSFLYGFKVWVIWMLDNDN